MRLKQNIKMILLLLILFLSMCLGVLFNSLNSSGTPIENIPIENIMPDTFKGNIKDNYDVPKEIISLITSYMDDYFESMYTLKLVDTSKYFSNTEDGVISNLAIKLMIESRKLYDFDFGLSDGHYDINITNYNQVDDKYYVDFLQDDYMCFNFLNGISSEAYDIENYCVIEKVNDEYKFLSLDKVQGYYMMFYDNYGEDMDALYDYYYKKLKNTIENENYCKQIAIDKPYVEEKIYEHNYDRLAASVYAEKYCHIRNDNWYDFSDEGGNCQNYASQVLRSGGILMDESGEEQWYFNTYSDYDSSWVHVSSFFDYCDNNRGRGLVCDINSNIYYAAQGDIVQVGIDSISHTTVVSKIVDGHILLNSNSIDMKDFPLEAYTYPTRKLIKILGSNS